MVGGFVAGVQELSFGEPQVSGIEGGQCNVWLIGRVRG